jgi:PAS domain S-box-containing protein
MAEEGTDDRDVALERNCRSLFELAADGIFFADPTDRHLVINSAGARMLGYSGDDIRSLRLSDGTASRLGVRRRSPSMGMNR